MKNSKVLLGMFAVPFLTLGFAFLFAGAAQAATIATALDVQGEVLLLKSGAAEDAWVSVSTDTALENGDSIQTKEGSCSISYADQGSFQLGSNSSVTVQDKDATQDLLLNLGTLRGKINKEKVIKPFQVVTPVAIAAVRGTEVDFDLNPSGELTIDLHNGAIQVFNGDDNGEMQIDLDGAKKITLKFNKDTGVMTVKNECGSDGPIVFAAQGANYSAAACEEVSVEFGTAGGDNEAPGTPGTDNLSETIPNENEEEQIPPPVTQVE